MEKYETKIFDGNSLLKDKTGFTLIDQIDSFLNAGLNERPRSEFSKEVVGYRRINNFIIITVKTFEVNFK